VAAAEQYEGAPPWLEALLVEVREIKVQVNAMAEQAAYPGTTDTFQKARRMPRTRNPQAMALRARIGKAAKAEGLSIDGWIAEHGCIEPPPRKR